MQEESPQAELLEEVPVEETVPDEVDEDVLAEFERNPDPDSAPGEKTTNGNGSGELTEGVTVVFGPESDSGPDVERLILTAANYFGVEPERVTNPRVSAADVATARVMVAVILKEEYDFTYEQAAGHLNRSASALRQFLQTKTSRQRLENGQRTRRAIGEGFRTGDTFAERATELKAKREEAARRDKSPGEQVIRVVPEEELRLFEAASRFGWAESPEEAEEAMREIRRRYLKPVRKAMAERAAELDVPLPRFEPRKSLEKTARYFVHVADRHEDFLGWAEKAGRADVDRLMEKRRQQEALQKINLGKLLDELYAAHQELYGTGQWNQATVELSSKDYKEFKRVFNGYKKRHPKSTIQYADYRHQAEYLFRTSRLLQDSTKGTDYVDQDSLLRRMALTDFQGAQREQLLELVLRATAQDGKTKRKRKQPPNTGRKRQA